MRKTCVVTYRDDRQDAPRRPNTKITIYYLLTGRLPRYFSGLLPEAVCTNFRTQPLFAILVLAYIHCIRDVLPN